MKKRVFGVVLAAALIVTQAVSVFAAGSKAATPALSGDYASAYQITSIADNSALSAVKDANVVDLILAVNEGKKSLQAVSDQAPEMKEVLPGKEMLTNFFDLSAVNGGKLTADGKYEVALSVPTLTASMTDVKLLHYSTVRSLWEIVDPKNVDYTNKEISAVFEDLSPVAVIAKTNGASVDNAAGTSPKTGMDSAWMIWMGAAVVLAFVGTAVYRKSSK